MENNVFSQRIYELRKAKGLSQKELGELIGVSNKAVSKWETGESLPKTSTIMKLAQLFEINPSELIADFAENDNDGAGVNEERLYELESLKSENEILKTKLNRYGKVNKKTQAIGISLFVLLALIVTALAVVINFEPPQNKDIADAGKSKTSIVFNGVKFTPANALEEYVFSKEYNIDINRDDDLRYAKYTDISGHEKRVTISPFFEAEIVILKSAKKQYIYCNREKVNMTIDEKHTVSFVMKSGDSAFKNETYSMYTYDDESVKGATVSDINSIKILCDFYNNRQAVDDKKITERFLSNDNMVCYASLVGNTTNFLPVGEFFRDGDNNTYFYDYTNGEAYYAGGQVSEIVYN